MQPVKVFEVDCIGAVRVSGDIHFKEKFFEDTVSCMKFTLSVIITREFNAAVVNKLISIKGK